MGADPSLREFARDVSRPDALINLGRAALAIARSEYPDLDVGAQLARLGALAHGVGPARGPADPLARLHRLREYLFEEQGFGGTDSAWRTISSLFAAIVARSTTRSSREATCARSWPAKSG